MQIEEVSRIARVCRQRDPVRIPGVVGPNGENMVLMNTRVDLRLLDSAPLKFVIVATLVHENVAMFQKAPLSLKFGDWYFGNVTQV